MTDERNRRILVIDDNESIHKDFRKIFTTAPSTNALDALEAELLGETAGPATAPARAPQGYEMASAFQGQEGFELVRKSVESGRRYALAFVDMRMPPGWDGLQTIGKICEVDPDLQIVICTAFSDYSWDDLFAKFGSMDRLLILKKPFEMVEVCQLACALTEKWHLSQAARRQLSDLGTMVREQTRELEINNARLLTEVEQRKRSEDRYRLVEAGANDGLWDWDLAAKRVYYSPRWKQMLGFGDAEIGDSEAEWLERVHPEDLPRMCKDLQGHFDGLSGQLCGEYRLRHKDGSYPWVLCRGIAVRDATGKPVRAAGSFTDITERKVAAERLLHDSLHDALTGLPNRTLFAQRVDRSLATALRTDYLFAVLFLDLDRFKIINDSLGHAAGDALLTAIARRISAVIRPSDVAAFPGTGATLTGTVAADAGRPLTVARMGGDEFTILVDNLQSPDDAARIAERVLTAVARPVEHDGHQLTVTGSVGIVVHGHGINSQYLTAKDLLRDADAAMYKAKTAGRARFAVFDQTMHTEVLTRLTLESELRTAVDRGELELHYQPIVSISLEKTVGLEALVRWRRNGVLVPPADFIPIAEETNLIVAIGAWVLRQACRQLAEWRASGPPMADLYVTVNVSRRQLADADFVATVLDVLRDTGLPGAVLGLEITETAIMEDPAATERSLADLKHKAGVRLLIDDFGTGYSSLSCLQRFPIDVLKIDRSFIKNVTEGRRDAAVMRTIVKLAQDLGMSVVAEGIESVSQLSVLACAGCELVQGFLFSRPLDRVVVPRFVAETGRSFATAAALDPAA